MSAAALTSAPTSRVDAWWRTKVDYPDPANRFRPTDVHDMLRSMRMMMRLTVVALVLLVAVFVAAIGGWALPGWTVPVFGAVCVGFMYGSTPPARYAAAGLLLSSVRRRWAETWLTADVPLTRLWMMWRSPVEPSIFAAYAEALRGDGSEAARLDGGTDPRLVWWLHDRGLSPQAVADYNRVGVDAVDVPALVSADITAEDWETLDRAGLLGDAPVDRVAEVLTWVRTSRVAVLPTDFDQADGQVRSVAACVPVLRAWAGSRRGSKVRYGVFDRWPCRQPQFNRPIQGGRPLACAGCGGTPETGHREWFGNLVMLDRTVVDWVDLAGLLAPYFVTAGIGYDEAQAMLASETTPTVADLAFLAAMANERPR